MASFKDNHQLQTMLDHYTKLMASTEEEDYYLRCKISILKNALKDVIHEELDWVEPEYEDKGVI